MNCDIKGKISVIKEFKNLVTKIKVLSDIKKIVLRGEQFNSALGKTLLFYNA